MLTRNEERVLGKVRTYLLKKNKHCSSFAYILIRVSERALKI
jgi:hypothetical protein